MESKPIEGHDERLVGPRNEQDQFDEDEVDHELRSRQELGGVEKRYDEVGEQQDRGHAHDSEQ